jgi:hypothetical protein
MERTINIVRSKKNIPCLWEQGGGATNTGEAQIIASEEGKPKRALYIARRGPLSCGEHALIPLKIGDYVINADHHRFDFHVSVGRIKEIKEEEAVLEIVSTFSYGEWDNEPHEFLKNAIEAAKDKACSYHCRTPKYILEENS